MDHLIDLDLPNITKPGQGGGGWLLSSRHHESWVWQRNLFTAEELEKIVALGNAVGVDKGRTGNPNDKTVRQSDVCFLYPNLLTSWIFQRLTSAIETLNRDFFGFDLSAMVEGLQFTRYLSDGGHYGWHVDSGKFVPNRKLSLVLQLSDPDEYSGGELQLNAHGKVETVPREQGLIVCFPSWTLHQVTPVSDGTRYSLVAWVSGPPFK